MGLKHLPRLWLKVLLHGCGILPDGYRHGTGGFDEFLTTTLGIDRDAFIAYIETEKPNYLALETWVRAHAASCTPQSIATVNARIERADLPEAMLAERYARIGWHEPGSTNAVALNDLDDWALLHESLTQPS